ncbi:hypothetical protein ACFO1B_47760 [Dactylosporangium siamense]|uniref:Uncharacterized protein n=1 Tax=Dactylosporangium siamense TaxID=685454 RepID=A0A919PYE9_9ACTN|nr:hypothetical protein [Dactylosporangium siamense]GIG51546.1 hypothetical protein Dsi01nite_095870 [Dactylosporangium siamense]
MTSVAARRVGRAAAALLWAAAAVALVGAAVLARDVGFSVLRQRVDVMVAVVAVLVGVAAFPVGPVAAGGGLAGVVRAAVGCVVALEVLGVAQVIRVVPPVRGDGGPRTGDGTVVLTVWLVLLGLVLLAAVRVTRRRAAVRSGAVGIAAGCGFAAAAGWLGLAALLPGVASSNVPALLLMMATGGVAAALIERRARAVPGDGRSGMAGDDRPGVAGDGRPRVAVGAAVAAMVTAVVLAAAIDGLLPLSHDWIRNSAPPWETGTRLVDPVGLLLVAGVLALFVAVGAGRTRTEATT